MPKLQHIHKVLVIGSGPIIIGQAAEFDYSGTQACLALKEEGVEVILINNNPATIMTDQAIADHIYMEPLTRDSLTAIIKKEKPDGILPTLGGQTGLNMAISLAEAGVLEQYEVELLGTSLDTIQKGEDRDIFKSMMKSIGEPVPESLSVQSAEEALRFARTAGYPMIVRPAYTLGGAGGGTAENEQELATVVQRGLDASPVGQVLVEQSIKGWKEIELEVVRDQNDTCIIVCDMENIDPAGVHTGDSIVVAPCQTVNAHQYHMLRSVSFNVIRELGVIGGCNIQFALHPDSDEYVIIEVNPRVSRSSALASKATGYPIARVAAKIAMGYRLDELADPITGHKSASVEPALDYVAVKIPRWSFEKFGTADRTLGTQMKATGEVMALAKNFPAALNKAIRSLDIGTDHFPFMPDWTGEAIDTALTEATDERLFVIAEAVRRGYPLERIQELTGIDRFFLNEIASVLAMEHKVHGKSLETITCEEWHQAKTLGLSDKTLASLLDTDERAVQKKGGEINVQPSYQKVDTFASSHSADTGYFYSTWDGGDESTPLNGQKVVVLGSGPIRVGQGVEFDYCSVQAAMSLQGQGIKSVVINNNPETVSTDYNTADHLYFEPLTAEDVLNVMANEQADGVMIQFGGQTAVNLAEALYQAGVHVYGTSLPAINTAEDRDLFYQLLQQLKIPHIPGETVKDINQAICAAAEIGYPVLVRPSYVIGGSGMVVLRDETELVTYLNDLQRDMPDGNVFPLLIDRFIPGHEFEIDAVCDGEDVLIPGVFQHIERAGVHSGDSIAVFPAPDLTRAQKQLFETYTKAISAELNVKGMVNIQFVLSEDKQTLYVLEVNPRASRTVPIASKVTGVPLIDLAVQVQTGKPLEKQEWKAGLHEDIPYYVVKMPVFSSDKLPGADPYLGPEMQSTGEAIGIGSTVEKAMAKACGWTEGSLMNMNGNKPVYLSLGSQTDGLSENVLSILSELPASITADPETAEVLGAKGITVDQTFAISEACNVCLETGFEFVCDTQKRLAEDDHNRLRVSALTRNTPCFTSAETLMAFLYASIESQEAPVSINTYMDSIHGLNKKKEQVV
ncbi:carbamoyl-phosphate synthase (glutamine-hydrolyzing) large subunit [Lentibacillus salinarum]|uniref:carbamoyl-phosphate synthase (ammonia) n=1 Tax=Lentibacillus salinarum TaxID=446820 RepID=A0ABW3ZSX2_9BACI